MRSEKPLRVHVQPIETQHVAIFVVYFPSRALSVEVAWSRFTPFLMTSWRTGGLLSADGCALGEANRAHCAFALTSHCQSVGIIEVCLTAGSASVILKRGLCHAASALVDGIGLPLTSVRPPNAGLKMMACLAIACPESV